MIIWTTFIILCIIGGLWFIGYLALHALGLPDERKEYGRQSDDWTDEEFKSIIDNLEEDDI
jgi:hypothetical protein